MKLIVETVEILLVTVLPVMLLQFGVVAPRQRMQVFFVLFSIAIISLLLRGASLKSLGIRSDNLIKAGSSFGLSIIFFLAAFMILVGLGIPRNLMTPGVDKVFNPIQYLFISVPIQQFIYFGYIRSRLENENLTNIRMAIIIGTLFGLMHLPWENNLLTFLTFCVGFVWAYLYARTPNLFISIISHVVLGGVLLYYL